MEIFNPRGSYIGAHDVVSFVSHQRSGGETPLVYFYLFFYRRFYSPD